MGYLCLVFNQVPLIRDRLTNESPAIRWLMHRHNQLKLRQILSTLSFFRGMQSQLFVLTSTCLLFLAAGTLSGWKPCASGSQEGCHDGTPEMCVRSWGNRMQASALTLPALCFLAWTGAQGPYTELPSVILDTDMGTIFKDKWVHLKACQLSGCTKATQAFSSS